MSKEKLKIGITQGDINGISYEVIIKALLDNRINEICTPVVYGSPKVAAYHRKALNIDNFSFNNIRTPEEANAKRANIINCVDENIRVELGKSTTVAGQSSYMALEAAVKDLATNKLDALITGPINKYNIQSDNFKFAGHTEYLADKFGTDEVLMLMVNDFFKVGVVTGHIPISEVPGSLTNELIIKKISILNKSLISDFGIRKPKIAVMGLNPHAGDSGIIGKEEIDIILPAIESVRENNILAFGPFPADGFFGSNGYEKYDAVLAMYHDQGLIPFKSMLFEGGVNFTAGLSVIRTSPAHGTAYEIAGKNEASPDSFRKSIYLACDIYRQRKNFSELTSNPLKSYDISEV